MRSLVWVLALVFFSSCLPHKRVTYLNDLPEVGSGELAIPAPPEMVFAPNDVVEVDVMSNSKETNAFFYKPGSDVDKKYAGNTYRINAEGSIDLPLIGQVEIGGKTMEEARLIVRDRLEAYMKNPTVDLRLVSFQITVLGEVDRPGVFDIYKGQVTLLEALGYAGDLTIFGTRNNVLVIRNTPSEKKYYRIDLSSSHFIESENYYLRNNDVVYVEPSKGRSSADDNAYRLLPLVLSTLTFVAVIIGLAQ